MLIIASLLLLITIPFILFIFNLSRPRFGYSWLIAAAGGFLVWILILTSRLFLPAVLTPPNDRNPVQNLISPLLLVDYPSWAVAMALSSLVFAYLLTDPTRIVSGDRSAYKWQEWSHGFAFYGISILAAFSGNIYTLLVAWAAFDLYEFIMHLLTGSNKGNHYPLLVAYSIRICSLFILIVAGLFLRLSFGSTDLTLLDRNTSMLLLLAAGLRFWSGAIYGYNSLQKDMSGLGIQISLASAGTSLVLLVRIAISNELSSFPWLIPISVSLFAVYCAFIWIITKNETARRIHWILAFAALAFIATLGGNISASLAWGIALLLAGGLIFNYSLHHRALRFLVLAGALSITSLPFTPTWPTVMVYSGPINGILPILGIITLLASQSLLLAGYVRQSLILEDTQIVTERWAWITYPIGLAIILISFFLIAWWGVPGLGAGLKAFPPLINSWPGLITVLLAGLILIFFHDKEERASRFVEKLQSPFSIDRSLPLVSGLYKIFESLIAALDRLFEGDGGLLWTILFLILILALLFQFRTGF
jgi:hypothetical protein